MDKALLNELALEAAANVAIGKLLPKLPESAPQLLKNVLSQCCQMDSEKRPPFSDIYESLSQ